MKKHIKLFTFLIFFFTSVSISYSQTPNTEDSVKQENSEQQSDNNALGHPGNLNGTNNSTGTTGGQSGESGAAQGNTGNDLLNTIINNNNEPAKEYVKGTRLPNEYSSGRTGGQFNVMQNPATAKPQSTNNNNNSNSTNPDYGNGFTDDANKAPETKTDETK